MDITKENTYQLEKLFNENYTTLVVYGYSIVKDEAEAKDIVQQLFVMLWQKMHEIDIHTSAKAYLYKAVYNASLDLIRHRQVKSAYKAYVLNNASQPDMQIQEHGTKELQVRIKQAIDALPEQCKKVFLMSREEGLRYKEIAVQLGIAEKTVENQMGKALKLLREALADYLPVTLLLFQLLYGNR